MHNVANTYAALGRHAEALQLREKALELQQARFGPEHSDTLAFMNGLAWSLATCPDPRMRDPARAVALARKAFEVDRGNPDFANTLGIAHYRAGDWKAAVEVLEKSRALRKGGDAFDWFFLAMAHDRLAHKDEARRWYDRAVEWTKKNAPQNEELGRFRAEAEQLLGITK
jgi:tetratricopeptide (TPR) repeat protein